jgi:hypothetical protein
MNILAQILSLEEGELTWWVEGLHVTGMQSQYQAVLSQAVCDGTPVPDSVGFYLFILPCQLLVLSFSCVCKVCTFSHHA